MTEKQFMKQYGRQCHVPRTTEDTCPYYYRGKCIKAKRQPGKRGLPCPAVNDILRYGILDINPINRQDNDTE